MTKIFIAGSRKFYSQVDQLVAKLKAKGVTGLTPMKAQDSEDFEHEKQALLTAFDMIATADFVYVVSQDGYVGKAVAMEMAYAYAKGKKIFSSEVIQELSARALVTDVMSEAELLT